MPRDYPEHTKKAYCLKIQLINGKRLWYRAGSKMSYAINQYAKSHHGQLPYKILVKSYINVPVTPYFKHNDTMFAGIAVGKIVFVKSKEVSTNMPCVRSQFIEPDMLLENPKGAYRYLRHDYNRYSKFQIKVDLYLWRKRLLNKKQKI